MNGIKMSDCKFYVDEDARVVVCVIPETSQMVREYIYEHFTWDDVDFDSAVNYGKLREAIAMPSSFRGKAVCAPEDEWNEETGKLIAFSRAKNKCYNSFFTRANLFVQTTAEKLGDAVASFNELGKKLEAKRDELHKEIESRVK